jgi:hypothetical protein
MPNCTGWQACHGFARALAPRHNVRAVQQNRHELHEHAIAICSTAAMRRSNLEASRASRKRAFAILQEIRWVLKDVAGIEIPPPAKKTIDLEGSLVKDGVRKALNDRQSALTDLIHAIREYRKAGEQPLTLRGSDYAPCRPGIEQGDRSGTGAFAMKLLSVEVFTLHSPELDVWLSDRSQWRFQITRR